MSTRPTIAIASTIASVAALVPFGAAGAHGGTGGLRLVIWLAIVIAAVWIAYNRARMVSFSVVAFLAPFAVAVGGYVQFFW